MATDLHYERAGDTPLASIFTATMMPDVDVSERTYVAYKSGANRLMHHLIAEDWEHLGDYDRQLIGVTIGRIIANAERQGVPISNPAASGFRGPTT
jgi:hypothetical protein